MGLTSGNLLHSYEKWSGEFDDLPMKNMVFSFFDSYVSLPEGIIIPTD
jgi:hypothetical protein